MFKILSIRTLKKHPSKKVDADQFNHEQSRFVSIMRMLKQETEYKFLSGTLPDDFYSKDKNINVSAIVGENGMGKSTLIQLMIRILNNVAYALNDAFDDDLHPRFIRSIYAELEYSIDDVVYCIRCHDDNVVFSKREDVIWTYNYSDRTKENKGMSFTSEVCQKAYAKNSANCAKTWLNEFFYTVTVDYSAYGLNYNDYFSELTDYNELDESEKGNVSQEETFWAYSIFHKNDEYQLPIVLNPYRSEGIIDYNNEIELTKSRVFMLALHHNNALNTIFDDKEVHSIRFDIRTDLNARPFVYFESFKVRYEMQRLGVVEYWKTAKIDEYKQLCDAIIKKWGNLYGFDIFEKLADRDKNDFIRAINYIVYKTINIAHTYKRYEKYLEVLY